MILFATGPPSLGKIELSYPERRFPAGNWTATRLVRSLAIGAARFVLNREIPARRIRTELCSGRGSSGVEALDDRTLPFLLLVLMLIIDLMRNPSMKI